MYFTDYVRFEFLLLNKVCIINYIIIVIIIIIIVISVVIKNPFEGNCFFVICTETLNDLNTYCERQ